MKFKCTTKDTMDLWLTEGEIYDGEIPVSPRDFSGGTWVYIYKVDDGYPAYVRKSQFIIWRNISDDLSV